MAQAEFDDPTNLLASVTDDLLEEVFACLGPCYIHLALTCRKFNCLLLDNGCVPCCERPPRCHPRGEYIMRDPAGFLWSCCEGSVTDPGCEEGDTHQHENDLERERHKRAYESTNDHDDIYSVDSMDWCERHCGCGYADSAYAYCLNSSLLLDRSYPGGVDTDDGERSSDEGDSENNIRCSGTAPPSKKREKREQDSDASDDEDHGGNSCSRSIGTGGSPTERTKIAEDSEHDDESYSEYE
jgi:hypothetical protein